MEQVLDISSRLRDSGLTNGWLILIGLLFALTLFISLRELLHWYLGVRALTHQVAELKAAIDKLERRLMSPKGTIHDLAFLGDTPEMQVPVSEKPQQHFPLHS